MVLVEPTCSPVPFAKWPFVVLDTFVFPAVMADIRNICGHGTNISNCCRSLWHISFLSSCPVLTRRFIDGACVVLMHPLFTLPLFKHPHSTHLFFTRRLLTHALTHPVTYPLFTTFTPSFYILSLGLTPAVTVPWVVVVVVANCPWLD